MSWIIHMDQSYRHPYCRRPYETIFDSEQNFFDGKCCHQHAVSSSPTSPTTSKLNLTLLADKFVGKIVEKLSILDLTRRDHCKQKNHDGKESLSLKNNKRKICKDDDDDEAFWPFIKLIIFFILTILFYYLMFSIDQRHRHLSSLQNGSMFNGQAYHTNGTNYFFLNRSMISIEKTIDNKSNSIAIGNYLRLPIANQLRSSIDNQSSSSTTDDKMMDDKQFIQYLFNNIQMWID
ncbi:hypothetical protein DERP_011667 [Dermatophagoides pteronyssinus]|uniref:Uncharacterized protein n=1 Tax=Dermatophagoides pteronyssinus TaxID=6956 RepID=A0ABQ8JWT6_DERPT|nr:hypothetical protein DERP_011667 [Dermatophagoides pteronyssinus]